MFANSSKFQKNSVFKNKISKLQQRDKKLLSIKNELKKEINSGTCMDMCPELERYFRIENKLLSYFELKDGAPDETKMIKEFSRSSAGQEFDLENCLRPEAVLEKTISYLIFEILDVIEKRKDLISEWYNFIWNRTRAIRKDIVQQQLCSPKTVEIIEKIARFHIFCLNYMSDQPISVFDTKLNNDNLVKCLQSIRQIYEELDNQKIYCENQAEFECYYILLNLDSTSIVQQISKLKKNIRTSPEVIFGIQVLLAYNLKNYFQYFNLFKKANYLNASLMSYYFFKMRLVALGLIKKAVQIGKSKIKISKEFFQKILIFNTNDLNSFCKLLNIDFDGEHVYIDKETVLDLNLINNNLKLQSIEDKRLDKNKKKLISELIFGKNINHLFKANYRIDKLTSYFEN